MRCGGADRWGRAATGHGGQQQGVGGRQKSEAVPQRFADGKPGPHNAGAWFKFGFKLMQKYSNGSNEI
jgi:hypothetical protein